MPLGRVPTLLPKVLSRVSFRAIHPHFHSYLDPGLLTQSILQGVVNCLREEISPFGIECCLITPGYYRTNIFAPTNIKFGQPSIPDYAELNKLYQAGVNALHSNQPGDPRKATDRIVDMVRSEGKAAGKTIPPRSPIGADAVEIIALKTSINSRDSRSSPGPKLHQWTLVDADKFV